MTMKTLERQIQEEQLRYYRRSNWPGRAARTFGLAAAIALGLFILIALLQSCGPKKPTAEERKQEVAERHVAHKNNLEVWNGTTEAKRRRLP